MAPFRLANKNKTLKKQSFRSPTTNTRDPFTSSALYLLGILYNGSGTSAINGLHFLLRDLLSSESRRQLIVHDGVSQLGRFEPWFSGGGCDRLSFRATGGCHFF